MMQRLLHGEETSSSTLYSNHPKSEPTSPHQEEFQHLQERISNTIRSQSNADDGTVDLDGIAVRMNGTLCTSTKQPSNNIVYKFDSTVDSPSSAAAAVGHRLDLRSPTENFVIVDHVSHFSQLNHHHPQRIVRQQQQQIGYHHRHAFREYKSRSNSSTDEQQQRRRDFCKKKEDHATTTARRSPPSSQDDEPIKDTAADRLSGNAVSIVRDEDRSICLCKMYEIITHSDIFD